MCVCRVVPWCTINTKQYGAVLDKSLHNLMHREPLNKIHMLCEKTLDVHSDWSAYGAGFGWGVGLRIGTVYDLAAALMFILYIGSDFSFIIEGT